jgi:hypothetical protein
MPCNCLDSLFRISWVFEQLSNAVMSQVIHPQPGQVRGTRHLQPCRLETGLMSGRVEKRAVDTEGKQEVVRCGRTESLCPFNSQLGGLVSFVIQGDLSYSASVLGPRRLNVDERLILIFYFHIPEPQRKNFLWTRARVYREHREQEGALPVLFASRDLE